MNKIISNAGSNEFGTWIVYTDGSSIKYNAILDVTITADAYGEEVIFSGRQGI